MSYKASINAESRTFHVSPVGNDSESGQSLETALLTIQAAIDKVNALVPPSSLANFSAVHISGAGQFAESDLTFPEGCQVNADNTFIFPTGGGITPGSQSAMNVGVALTSASGASVYTYNDSATIGVNGLAAICFGDNSFCMNVSGLCKEISVTMDQFRVGGVGSVGLLQGCDDDDLFIGKIDNIILNSNDTTGIRHAHATNNSIKSAFGIIAISEESGTSLTGTIGLDIQRGDCDAVIGSISAETVIHVASGASLSITCSCIHGNVIVDAGGVLHCEIPDQSAGTVTNNGEIHGRIGHVVYGDQIFIDDITVQGDILSHGNFYKIPLGTSITISENKQNLTSGDLDLQGELIINGEMVVI